MAQFLGTCDGMFCGPTASIRINVLAQKLRDYVCKIKLNHEQHVEGALHGAEHVAVVTGTDMKEGASCTMYM